VRALLLACLLSAPLGAAVAPNLDKGLALQGYDPVCYVDESRAAQGSDRFSLQRGAATYWFASAEHLAAFKKNPARYELAYGGWCAYAMSRGELVDVDPRNFKVVHGKVLLFYRSIFVDTLKKWNDREAELLPQAEAAWTKLNQSVTATSSAAAAP
jgi:YHS domain-containing protein